MNPADMKSRVVVLACFCAMIFVACQVDPQAPESNHKRFFDLEEYFAKEAVRLGEIGKARKTVFVGGKKEVLVLDSIGFGRDLQVFSKSDINRPAWSDKYAIDSIFSQNTLAELRYHSKDDNLKTQSIVIDFDDFMVSKIVVENNASSFFASSSQLLTYEPQHGYSIKSEQKVASNQGERFGVSVEFVE
jgi:hypothetical protein